MKTLVLFYSFEGNTRFIAKEIATAINSDILELKVEMPLQKKGFMKYVWGGRQAFMKEKPKLLTLEKNPNDYDVIFIGTPVWAWRYAPALNPFFSEYKITGKKIAVFCCHGGGKGKTLQLMKKKLTGNNFIGEENYYEPLSKDKEGKVTKARKWAREIVKNI